MIRKPNCDVPLKQEHETNTVVVQRGKEGRRNARILFCS